MKYFVSLLKSLIIKDFVLKGFVNFISGVKSLIGFFVLSFVENRVFRILYMFVNVFCLMV